MYVHPDLDGILILVRFSGVQRGFDVGHPSGDLLSYVANVPGLNIADSSSNTFGRYIVDKYLNLKGPYIYKSKAPNTRELNSFPSDKTLPAGYWLGGDIPDVTNTAILYFNNKNRGSISDSLDIKLTNSGAYVSLKKDVYEENLLRATETFFKSRSK